MLTFVLGRRANVQGPAGTARKMVQMSPDAGKLMALSVRWGPTWEGTDQVLAACEILRLASMLRIQHRELMIAVPFTLNRRQACCSCTPCNCHHCVGECVIPKADNQVQPHEDRYCSRQRHMCGLRQP